MLLLWLIKHHLIALVIRKIPFDSSGIFINIFSSLFFGKSNWLSSDAYRLHAYIHRKRERKKEICQSEQDSLLLKRDFPFNWACCVCGLSWNTSCHKITSTMLSLTDGHTIYTCNKISDSSVSVNVVSLFSRQQTDG